MATKEETVRLRVKRTHPKRQMARKIMIFTSFMLFPITIFYLSPFLSIMGPIEGFISGAILVFGSLFIFSLFMGRIFCSYICSMAGMMEAMAHIQKRRINRKSFFVKWIIFIPWIAVIILLPILFGQPFQGVDAFFGIDTMIDMMGSMVEIRGISILSIQGIVIYYIVVAVIVLLGFIIGKRSFCHHMCWIGPFMVIGRKISNWTRIPSLRLKPENENCIDCKRCTRKCPMSLNVNELVQRGDMEDSNCILCGECIDECPKNVIHYTFTSHKKAKVAEVKVES